LSGCAYRAGKFGGAIDILVAEAMAFYAGCEILREVRDRMRSQLLAMGPGAEMLGQEG